MLMIYSIQIKKYVIEKFPTLYLAICYLGSKPGRKPVLSTDIERSISQKITTAADKGFGISRAQVMIKAALVAKNLKLEHPFKNGSAGKDWFSGFKKRNQDITIRKPQKISTQRSKGMERGEVMGYFNTLKSQLDLVNSNPNCVWNMDEKGFQLEHKPVSVVARKGAKVIPGRVSSSRDNITVVGCGNANGKVMPPLIIVKGKTHKSLYAYDTSKGPAGTEWTYQQKAWTEDVLGCHWFHKIFLRYCGDLRPQLLVVDQHHSHEVTELLEEAQTNDIIILGMPPHTSHWLQPLDKGCYGPLAAAYNKVCSTFMSQGPQNVVTKANWPSLFNEAWQLGMCAENMISGFRITGIYPYNPSSIPMHAYTGNLQTEIEDECDHNSSNLSAEHNYASESATLVNDPSIEINAILHGDDNDQIQIESDVNVGSFTDVVSSAIVELEIQPVVGSLFSDEGSSDTVEAEIQPVVGSFTDVVSSAIVEAQIQPVIESFTDVVSSAMVEAEIQPVIGSFKDVVSSAIVEAELQPVEESDVISTVTMDTTDNIQQNKVLYDITVPISDEPSIIDIPIDIPMDIPLDSTFNRSLNNSFLYGENISFSFVNPSEENEINKVFSFVTNKEKNKVKKCQARPLNGHRILTSSEIINKKRDEENAKQEKEDQKQERKIQAAMKKRERLLKQISKQKELEKQLQEVEEQLNI